jgi:tripartite-type tricarboxylate transporter receptor subunit TctC
MRKLHLLTAVVVALCFSSHQRSALADDFPSKPITIITPYSAGGPYDILARFLSESIRKQKLSQPVIVEAKPGGNTLVGIQTVLQAPADGHTVLVSTQPILSNLTLMKNPGYKADDFVAVGPVAKHPFLFFVPASLPVTNLKDLLGYAEKNPNKLNIGALSPGGQVQLLADRFIRASNLKIEKIPYKGAADLATALLTGDIQMSFFAYSAGAPFLKDGKLKAVAIATDERSPLTPDVPTFKELGLPSVTGESWVALFATSRDHRQGCGGSGLRPEDSRCRQRALADRTGQNRRLHSGGQQVLGARSQADPAAVSLRPKRHDRCRCIRQRHQWHGCSSSEPAYDTDLTGCFLDALRKPCKLALSCVHGEVQA